MTTPRPGFHDPGNYALTEELFHYPLPKGLAKGTRVRILEFDHGFCRVKDKAGNVWERVFMAALRLVDSPRKIAVVGDRPGS